MGALAFQTLIKFIEKIREPTVVAIQCAFPLKTRFSKLLLLP